VYCLRINVYCTVLLPPGVNPTAVNKYISINIDINIDTNIIINININIIINININNIKFFLSSLYFLLPILNPLFFTLMCHIYKFVLLFFSFIYLYFPFYTFSLHPTNAQLSHNSIHHNSLLCNLHCYMFRHFRVIIRQFTANALLRYTSSSNCNCWKYVYNFMRYFILFREIIVHLFVVPKDKTDARNMYCNNTSLLTARQHAA